MKNLVMGVSGNYDWYAVEPFVRSCKQHYENTDIVLFIGNISNFTRNALIGEGVLLVQIPAELKNFNIENSRWIMYSIFLARYGGNYGQVFLTDVRDVIFQGNLFTKFAEMPKYLCCATDQENIKNDKETLTYDGLTRLFGNEVAEKLGDKKIICAGTVLGTLNEVRHLAEKMTSIVKPDSQSGEDQAALNYLVYENQLDIENFIESDCESGFILSSDLFHTVNPIQIQNNKILRGDGGAPDVVHKYNKYPVLVELADKIYRDKDFKPNNTCTDTRSIFEQLTFALNADKLDDAHKLFTRYLFGNDLKGYGNDLVKIFEMVLAKDSTLAAELLSISIQGTLPSAVAGLDIQQVMKICSLADRLIKSGRLVIPQFKHFLKEMLYFVAELLYDTKQFEQCVNYLNFITALNVPLDANFYLLQAKVYRETGRKAEALAAYSKALNF